MIPVLLPTTMSADLVAAHYRPEPAIYQHADVMDSPWPKREVGTGGIAQISFLLQPYGYCPCRIFESGAPDQQNPFSKLMQEIRGGFGRTMSYLPPIFGVSRQTLYNWLDGEIPKAQHQEKLRQLAKAANMFFEFGLKPTGLMLNRTIGNGKTFLELVASGADGEDSAKKLIYIAKQGADSRKKLDELLFGRKGKLEASDIGSPLFNEDV